MHVGQRLRPVGVDVRHVHPRGVGFGEGVEETLFGLVDLGDTEDVVDVADDRHAGVGDEVGRRVACLRAIGVDVQALDLLRSISRNEPTRYVLDRYKGVEVTLRCSRIWKLHGLITPIRSDGTATTLLSRTTLRWRRLEEHGDILVALLHDEDLRREIASLG